MPCVTLICMAEKERPKVGVGVLIFKEGRVLLGKRKNSHGEGEFAGPGGHVEFGESLEEAVARETMEETGVTIKDIVFLTVSNLLIWDGKHYLDFGFKAAWEAGEPEVKEPEKCSDWNWYDPKDLPSPLFPNVPIYFNALTTGTTYNATIRK